LILCWLKLELISQVEHLHHLLTTGYTSSINRMDGF
jgi:hypothetical protein